MTTSARLLTGLGLLEVERGHLAADGEIGIVEDERARDAVLVELESDGIDRLLLAALLRFLILLLEIADGHRPARELGKLGEFCRRIFRQLRARRDRAADHGERAVEFLAGFRPVIDRKFQDGFAFARGDDDAPHVLGREYRAYRNREI